MTTAAAQETRVGLLARIEAKPEHAREVEELLIDALALAHEEIGTPVWFALRFGPSMFGVFDARGSDDVRRIYLENRIVAAVMDNAPQLLEHSPEIFPVHVLAAKIPD